MSNLTALFFKPSQQATQPLLHLFINHKENIFHMFLNPTTPIKYNRIFFSVG